MGLGARWFKGGRCVGVCVCVHPDSKLKVLAMTCGCQSVPSARDFHLFRKQGAAGSPQFCCQRRRLWMLREADWDANLCTCKSAAQFVDRGKGAKPRTP